MAGLDSKTWAIIWSFLEYALAGSCIQSRAAGTWTNLLIWDAGVLSGNLSLSCETDVSCRFICVYVHIHVFIFLYVCVCDLSVCTWSLQKVPEKCISWKKLCKDFKYSLHKKPYILILCSANFLKDLHRQREGKKQNPWALVSSCNWLSDFIFPCLSKP